ncbi:hypothetical protein BaRGS_00014126 [Batillaria attramentaria]|uniref:Uncharacterized protein n=1 Tax=Batillaria attramentaria TaxID=370345 RepID=A0ABD0L5Z8_9CAEN
MDSVQVSFSVSGSDDDESNFNTRHNGREIWIPDEVNTSVKIQILISFGSLQLEARRLFCKVDEVMMNPYSAYTPWTPSSRMMSTWRVRTLPRELMNPHGKAYAVSLRGPDSTERHWSQTISEDRLVVSFTCSTLLVTPLGLRAVSTGARSVFQWYSASTMLTREKERGEAEDVQRWTKTGSFRRSHNMKLKGNISQSHETCLCVSCVATEATSCLVVSNLPPVPQRRRVPVDFGNPTSLTFAVARSLCSTSGDPS